jgi:cysteine-rich repeat protein
VRCANETPICSAASCHPACGDGVLEPGLGEQCDPGPTPVAGCSPTCQLTGDFLPETESNDTQALASGLNGHQGFIGAIQPAGDYDYFSFAVTVPGSHVTLQVSDGIGGCPAGFDSVLTLFDPSHAAIVSDDNGGSGLCSAISPAVYRQAANLAVGTYTARVEFKGGLGTTPLYVLTVTVRPPACGDGLRDTGEQCDDGASNGAVSDGCSASCQSLPPWEIEPNDTTAQATPAWPSLSTWKGAITPPGDHDYFRLTPPVTGTLILVTHDLDKPTTCTVDTLLHLLDGNGVELTEDDDGGPGPGDSAGGRCSRITMAVTAGNTYFAWVQRYGDAATIAAYQLDFSVQ